MSAVLFVGEMLVDFIPNQSLAATPVAYQAHPGGAVANAAVALARLGGSARFIGKLSEDSFGRLLLHTLQENRVDTRYVPFTHSGPTTLVLVTLRENGGREFTFYRQQTADTLLESAEITPQVWDEVAWCHAGSVLLASEPARSATLAALEQACQGARPVSFDVNVRPTIWSSEAAIRETLERVIGQVDLLKFSAEEAHYLDPSLRKPLDPADGKGLRELGARLLTLNPRLVIVTRGPQGALLMNAQHAVEVPASTLRALDTTGAGDAFMGAVLQKCMEYGWTNREQLSTLGAEEIQEIGEFANRVAGISCTRYGGIASLPYRAEVEQV